MFKPDLNSWRIMKTLFIVFLFPFRPSLSVIETLPLWKGKLINRAARGLARFILLYFFFLVLSVTRPSPSLGQVLVGTLNHVTCNVYSPKAFETLIHENVTHIVFFIVSEIYFLFVLSKSSIQSERTCQNVQGLRHW